MNYLTILGRQPEIGLAELEALNGAENMQPIGNVACLLTNKQHFARIGASVKQATIIEMMDKKPLSILVKRALPHITEQHTSGKLQLGVSVYGTKVSPNEIQRAALYLKKTLRANGISVRLVPNRESHLNAAQVLRNKLHKDQGFELVIVFDGAQAYLAKGTDVQDIDAYAYRDREKPERDPLVGMLPPKLAQTLINLTNVQPGQTILDPFCGTGTLLIEALNMGVNALGSDISPKMVDASHKNVSWFTYDPALTCDITHADATKHAWKVAFQAVAAETFLGPALQEMPDQGVLDRIIEEVDALHVGFLENLASQLSSGTPVALAVPAWRVSNSFRHLPSLDYLEKLGYNPTSFVHAESDKLVYHRPQQLVGRRILSLVRK